MTAPAITAFLDAMAAAGMRPVEPTMDRLARGELVRFRAEGDRPGKRNGAARLFMDGVPGGWWKHWRTGERRTWRADTAHAPRPGAAADHALRRAQADAIRRREHEAAAARAAALWDGAAPASAAQPYLVRKGMAPDGLREHAGRLLVPMRDVPGRLWNVQRIAPDGSKWFLPGARVGGVAWWRGKPGPTIAIGEGAATMAAVHAATGWCAVAAMMSGNLLAAALAVRVASPNARLILCADDAAGGEGNPGMAAAEKAARAVRGLVARPPRPPGWPDDRSLDFDDALRGAGPAAVRRALGCDTPNMETPHGRL